MEVASPLTFGHVKTGTKRRFATRLDAAIDANVDDYAMDDSNAYGQSFKKRRCGNHEMAMNHLVASDHTNPFGSTSLSIPPQVHTVPAMGNKRQRKEEVQDATHINLRTIIDRQSIEIHNLKSEKQKIENSYKDLSVSHDKNQKENTALKKVLAIKQQRQEHFVKELENAGRYKEQAEQLIAVLRQHLHAQQSHGNSSGMGFNNGGPHVY